MSGKMKSKLIISITASYLLLTAVPFAVMYAVTVSYWWNSSQATSIKHSENILLLTKQLLNTHIKHMDNLTISLYYEPSLIAMLSDQTLSSNSQKRSMVIPQFEKLFRNMSYTRSDLFNYYYFDMEGNLIYIYWNGVWIDYVPLTNYSPKEESWFTDTIEKKGAVHIFTDKLPLQQSVTPLLSMSRLIQSSTQSVGIVLMDFNFNVLDEIADISAFDIDNQFIISNRFGDIIYSKAPSHDLAIYQSLPQALLQTMQNNNRSDIVDFSGQSFLVVHETIHEYGLKLIHMVPTSQLMSENLRFFAKANVLVGVLVLLLFVASIVYFRKRLRPLSTLATVMNTSIKEPFETRVAISSRDEIGVLELNFNKMMDRLKHLIETNYKVNLEIAEREKKMLEAQINPHFLYNTLDTIRFVALEQGSKDISKMLYALSSNLRYTLNQTNAKVMLSEEIKWLERYIFLQKVRFKDRFDVYFQFDINTHEQLVYPLILQPFIENAIHHGFKDMEAGGILHINGYMDMHNGSKIVCFEIVDNGCGFPKPVDITINNNSGIQHIDMGNIGMKNAFQRLFLYYGSLCEIYINSKPNRGTAIKISIALEGTAEHENTSD